MKYKTSLKKEDTGFKPFDLTLTFENTEDFEIFKRVALEPLSKINDTTKFYTDLVRTASGKISICSTGEFSWHVDDENQYWEQFGKYPYQSTLLNKHIEVLNLGIGSSFGFMHCPTGCKVVLNDEKAQVGPELYVLMIKKLEFDVYLYENNIDIVV